MTADLFEWLERPYQPGEAKPWAPKPLSHADWPPDYRAVFAWRIKQLAKMRADANFRAGAIEYYRTHRKEFALHWLDTYDPRTVGAMKWKPFVFFERQSEAWDFLSELERDQEGGLIEKCRDMGLTWLSVSYTTTKWRFDNDAAIGWGSRKEILVDKLGDPDSIFEKIRLQIRRMPREFLPAGFSWGDHATFMKLINPENGSIVAGEAGDNIGRGGRKGIYFCDESAHYERPELVSAALGDNTNVRVDISSVNGLGNVFHRMREAGEEWEPGKAIAKGRTRVLVVDWRDHPEKTQEWYDRRRAKWEADGMLHIFKQEVDRDYSGAVQNTIIPMEWIRAAVGADKRIRWLDARGTPRLGLDDEQLGGGDMAALDVADGGIDRNALARRKGIKLTFCDDWGDRDPGHAARKVIVDCKAFPGIQVMYDSVGIGSAVKSEFNRLIEDGQLDGNMFEFVSWSAGAKVINPFRRVILDDDESPLNKDFYGNLKAQGWWSLRLRFWRTYQNVVQGILHPIEDMIIIDDTLPKIRQLEKELAQPTSDHNGALKMIVNKTPDGTRSPNLADAVMMCYFPVDSGVNYAVSGNYGS